MTKMTKLFRIFVDETKTKTKIRTGDENEIKINGVLVMTKISDEKLALTAFIRDPSGCCVSSGLSVCRKSFQCLWRLYQRQTKQNEENPGACSFSAE